MQKSLLSCLIAAAILYLNFPAFAQDAQPAPRASASAVIGVWKNTYTGGRCQFFPALIDITVANATDVTVNGKDTPILPAPDWPYKETAVITKYFFFDINGENGMIYHQAGPDGMDQCFFSRADAAAQHHHQ